MYLKLLKFYLSVHTFLNPLLQTARSHSFNSIHCSRNSPAKKKHGTMRYAMRERCVHAHNVCARTLVQKLRAHKKYMSNRAPTQTSCPPVRPCPIVYACMCVHERIHFPTFLLIVCQFVYVRARSATASNRMAGRRRQQHPTCNVSYRPAATVRPHTHKHTDTHAHTVTVTTLGRIQCPPRVQIHI